MHEATDIPEVEPVEVTAGDSIKWTRDLSTHYPADEWTLTYYALGTKGKFEITATADGEEFSIAVTAAASAAYQPGEYTIVGKVTDIATGLERHNVYSGKITVLLNPAQLGAEFHDDRTFARKALDAIEACLAGRASRADSSYQIAGRSLQYFSLKELQDARARFKAEVAAEQARIDIANGKASGRRILTQFVSPR